MRTIMFIGGLAADKHLFALVNEDPVPCSRAGLDYVFIGRRLQPKGKFGVRAVASFL
jgi:hypothetical protein